MQLSETEVRFVHEAESIAYEREAGRHRLVHWNGAPRQLERRDRPSPLAGDPPQYDPAWLASIGEVSTRTLEAYAAVAEEVAP